MTYVSDSDFLQSMAVREMGSWGLVRFEKDIRLQNLANDCGAVGGWEVWAVGLVLI